MSEWFLRFRDASFWTILDNKTLGVSQPNMTERLLPAHSFSLLHGHGNQHGNTHRSLASSLEEEGVVSELPATSSESCQDTSQSYTGSALDTWILYTGLLTEK